MPSTPKIHGGGQAVVNVHDIEKLVEAWVSSKQGTEKLLATRESAKAAADFVNSEAQIEPEHLRQSVTL